MADTIAIVGASVAGVHAAEALREGGYQGAISLLGGESYLPYDRTRLVHAATAEEHKLFSLRPPQWYAANRIDLALGQVAVGVDVDARTVRTSAGRYIAYSGLIVATGSRSRPLGDGSEHVQYVRSLADAQSLQARLRELRSVVVIGAGFLGLELAAAMRARGCQVSVVEIAPAPLARVLGDNVGVWFQRLHERHGVTLRCSTLAVGVERWRDRYRVRLHDGDFLEADLILGALGAVPNDEWLSESEIERADGVVCDGRLRASVAGVVAAGDVARWYNPLFDEVMRVEQWTNAVEQGRHAALSLLGSDETYHAVPFMWSDQYNAKMRFVGVANAAADIQVHRWTETSLVATYARDGVQVGGLCVNAPRQLAGHRWMIEQRGMLPNG